MCKSFSKFFEREHEKTVQLYRSIKKGKKATVTTTTTKAFYVRLSRPQNKKNFTKTYKDLHSSMQFVTFINFNTRTHTHIRIQLCAA